LGKRPSLLLLSLASLPLLAVSPAAADVLGRVVSVHDGDTLTVLVESRQMKIRLADIDAPELGQPFGSNSKRSLSDMCFGKIASVDVRTHDRYQRAVAQVTCAGTDANAEQVRRGYAWAYARYARRDSPLHSLQAQAQSAQRGLWSDSTAVPPWEWRKNGRH
jgi:endonuclease YncB( thermonuclease family)